MANLVQKLSNIDPASMPLVVDGKTMKGYANGTQLNITWNADFFTPEKGNDGEDTRILTNNYSAVLTVTLAQSSDSNDVLSALINEDLTTAQKVFDLRFTDLFGTSQMSSGKCYILKYADIIIANTGQARAWRIHCPNLRGVVGGNTAL